MFASLACTCIGDARSVTSEEMHVHVKRCGEEVNGVVGVHPRTLNTVALCTWCGVGAQYPSARRSEVWSFAD